MSSGTVTDCILVVGRGARAASTLARNRESPPLANGGDFTSCLG